MGKMSSTVCVTGGASYVGSWLIKKLLDQGHVVHATLRNLGDKSKVGMLKELPGAESRLALFEADIYDAEKYEAAIRGCEFVYLVATPYSYQHDAQNIKYKDTVEAAVDAVRIILRLCEECGSVKRVVYTGSVTAASPLREDGTGYKGSIDELCWTPLHLSFPHSQELEKSPLLVVAAVGAARLLPAPLIHGYAKELGCPVSCIVYCTGYGWLGLGGMFDDFGKENT